MDIAIRWIPNECRGDFVIEGGDIALDSPLKSAVMVSLFTDRVAPETVTADAAAVGIRGAPDAAGSNKEDRRGWWADAYAEMPIGSRLWQMARTIKAGQTAALREVEAICYEALEWLVTDGVAQSINVTAEWASGSLPALLFTVKITEPGKTATQEFLFSWAWEGMS